MTKPIHDSLSDTALFVRSPKAIVLLQSQTLLQCLLDTAIIHPDDWDNLPKETRERIFASENRDALMKHLVEFSLVNPYQAARSSRRSRAWCSAITAFWRAWVPAAAIVAESRKHRLLRRKVAIKVLPVTDDERPALVTRFLREMRAVARLNHPNIVAAFDAGLSPAVNPGDPDLYYFAMEHLTGNDLEQEIQCRSASKACAGPAVCQHAGRGPSPSTGHQASSRPTSSSPKNRQAGCSTSNT